MVSKILSVIIFIFTVSILFPKIVYTQSLNPLRLELNARLDENTYKLIPCEDKGVLVFYKGVKSKEKGSWWHFALFDAQLQEQWILDTLLIENVEYVDHDKDNDYVYLLFYKSDRNKEGSNLQIMRIDPVEGYIKIQSFVASEKSTITGFEVIYPYAYFGVNHRKNSCSIGLCTLSTNDIEEQYFDFTALAQLRKIYYDNNENKVFSIIDQYISKDDQSILISAYNMGSLTASSTEVQSVLSGKYLNNAEVYFCGDTLFVLGTYSNDRRRKTASDEDDYPESSGYFISQFINGSQKYIHYYNFLEFDNLYDSFGNMDVMQVKRKSTKQKKKGEEYSLDYRLILHPVIDFNNQIILISESFYPEYRTVTNMTYDYYGRMMPQTYTVFDGYRYLSGIVASFNKEGQLLWNGEIEMQNIMTFELQDYVNAFPVNNELALFYNNNGKISYKIFDNEDEYDVQNLNLKLKYSRDRIIDDEGGQMIHWYDNYFLCYGYQEIRNNSRANSKRTVFYLSKVAFQ